MKAVFKRMLALIFALALFSLPLTVAAEQTNKPTLSAQSAILYEAHSDTVLWERNAHAPMPMASTTKIMTALAALDALDPDEYFPFPAEAVGVEGSSAYLTAGEILSVKDMLYALLLQSANDVATALALLSDGSVEAFAERMNALAKDFGCESTHFENPHGLHSENHYTTAADLAIIAKKLLENELLAAIVKTKVYTAKTSTLRRTFVNHNKLLSFDKDAVGVKTGFTKSSGRCLVGAAEKNGMLLISVTLNAPSDWSDHAQLWKYVSDRYEYKCILKEHQYYGNLSVVGSIYPFVSVTNKEKIELLVKKSSADIEMHTEALPLLALPIKKGQVLGRLVLTQNGKEIRSLDLVATHDVYPHNI